MTTEININTESNSNKLDFLHNGTVVYNGMLNTI